MAEIDRFEVQALLARGAQLVDVMPPAEFEESHLEGAINIPLRDLAREAPARLQPDVPVVVYCYDSL